MMIKQFIACFFFAAMISGCVDIDEQQTAPVQSQAANVPSSSARDETSIESIQLQSYDGGFFSINKPPGWNVTTAGSCSTFSLLIRDNTSPERQIFYFGEVGPVYLNGEQKTVDRQYMDMGGYPITWYEMPVVDPLTPENFLGQFHLIAQTNIAKNFMQQMPELNNIEIISSYPAKSPLQGDTKIVRALFMQKGNLTEGLFFVTVAPLLSTSGYAGGGIGYAFTFIGISAQKDKFKNLEKTLTESIGSLSISQTYVNNCIQQQNQATQGILKAGRTLSETSDIIMSSWENRNRAEDIISEKRSDAIMGRDRVYDPATGEVYKVQNGFYDSYDINREKYTMSDLQLLPGNDWNLWTSPMQDASRIR